MSSKIDLQEVVFIPKELEPGILYVSEKYQVAAHLCACGCGNKIVTPLDECEWTLTIDQGRASLDPSIGNWQIPCRSHYWITDGQIEWSLAWSEERIEQGRQLENERRVEYYRQKQTTRIGIRAIWVRFIHWIRKLFS